MSSQYDLVVFDFDGTLADSLTWFRSEMSDVLTSHGLPAICEEKAETLRGLAPREILQALEIPNWKLPFIVADVQKRAAKSADQITLYKGVPELLANMAKQGVDIALVSSNGEEAVREVLGKENSAHISQFACGAALFGKAAIFKKVIKRAKTTACKTLCIGDEVRDLEAAKEAGCGSGAVSWGFATREILQASKPDHIFDTVSDIASCLSLDSAKHTMEA